MDVDDLTPTDATVAIVQLSERLRDVCAALDRVGPLYATTPRADRPFVLEHLIAIANEGRDGFADYLQALIEQLEIETVFRPR